MINAEHESKRIRKLHKLLVAEIPRSPNNRDSLKAIEAKSLTEVIIIYLNYASRRVRPEKRTVTIEPTLTIDHRWKGLSNSIEVLLDKARDGDDLTPYLSTLATDVGFSMDTIGPAADSWADKDLILNAMGYHHFHLKPITAGRTDEMLFAEVSRTQFTAIGLFDHDVWESRGDKQLLTAERKRLWKLFKMRTERGMKPGTAYFMTDITTSGHRGIHVDQAIRYVRTIRQVDPQLDELAYKHDKLGLSWDDARKTKLAWIFYYNDFYLFDGATNKSWSIGKGQT